MKTIVRKGTKEDLPKICEFVDYWLSGRAKSRSVKYAGNDYFISPRQHRKYLSQYDVVIAWEKNRIVGWAVKQHQETLIHLLIAGDCRHLGIGSLLLKALAPRIIRCKTDQSTGDPTSFFENHGFQRLSNLKVGRRRHIILLTNL